MRWNGELDEYNCFLKNLQHIRRVACDSNSDKITPVIKSKLFDDIFVESIKEEVEKLIPICKFIDFSQSSSCTLAESYDEWMKLKDVETLRVEWKKRDKKLAFLPALIGHSLHPGFKGRGLDKKKSNQVNQALLSILASDAVDDLISFREGKGSFGNPRLEKLNAQSYWKLMQNECPKLAEIAILYVSLPSSTASIERLFSMWKHVHDPTRNRLSKERSEKVAFLYHILNTQR